MHMSELGVIEFGGHFLETVAYQGHTALLLTHDRFRCNSCSTWEFIEIHRFKSVVPSLSILFYKLQEVDNSSEYDRALEEVQEECPKPIQHDDWIVEYVVD
ncbi:hypothetical protein P3T76_005886 [Phytophthora citrophthora]|uniref:Uncharacterized protein n=1 Tax=Phytophthora citrophthora TaxID=4793 RepID=A0AAD9GPQ2_9STRA|nr:hypothetical protein P3T76_005886 [Phytophthora citrophthora]